MVPTAASGPTKVLQKTPEKQPDEFSDNETDAEDNAETADIEKDPFFSGGQYL